MIDLLRSELGEVEAVRAQLDIFVPERLDREGQPHKVTADEHATFSMRFESGARAELVTSTAVRSARGFTTSYTGSKRSYTIVDEERLMRFDAAT